MSKGLPPTEALKLFYSYSHKDEDLRDELETHLSMLRRQKVIANWHDRRIVAGEEWGGEIDEHLKTADIILLLVSADFLASDYCYDIELGLAMERHEAGDARVIPVIMRPCDWTGAPFGKLQALPKNARPVKSWPSTDEAFTDVAKGIRKAAEALLAQRPAAAQPTGATPNVQTAAAPKAVPSSIPRPPIVGFVARRDEQGRDIVQLLGRELAPDKNQLVALWGPGGSGKTTLAAEFVRATAAAFKQRVAWVSALGRAEFSLATLLDEIATRLGHEDLRKLAAEPKVAAVASLVSDAPTLVILDNFETISEEEQARCLDFLAQHATCPALITTRVRVNRDDVYNVPLAAMTMEEAHDFLQRLVERTRKRSNFDRLDRDDLIRRCEANPIILQWVVSQIDLAKRPQDVLDELARGEGDAAERVFTRSFDLPQLGEDGRAVLLALSVFAPDASHEALAEVAGFGDDLRRLRRAVEGLSALWLVETTEGNERLFLRGLTRELAKSRRLNDPRADEFRRRYVVYFLRYAEAHDEVTPEALDALEAERENLLGAMDEALALRDWDAVMRLQFPLYGFLYTRGYWDEGIRSGERAEAVAREVGDEWNVGIFKVHVANIRSGRGAYEAASQAILEAIEIFKGLGAEDNVAASRHQLANIRELQGDLDEAQRLYEQSLEFKKSRDDRKAMASTLHQLGNVAVRRGDLDAAQRLYSESLELSESLGLIRNIAHTLHQLGMVAQKRGDPKEARRLYESSLEIRKRLGDPRGTAISLAQLGTLAYSEGDAEEAARNYQEALTIFEKLGAPEAERAREDLAMAKAALAK